MLRLVAEQAAVIAPRIRLLPPEVAGEVVDELLRRDQERAGVTPSGATRCSGPRGAEQPSHP